MTKVVKPSGRPPVSEATREKIRATNRAKYAGLTPEQQAAQVARLGRKPRSTPPTGGPPPPAPPAPPAPPGGPTNPLDDAPGGRQGRGPGPQGRVAGPPPRFNVPELPPLELGSDDGPAAGAPDIDQGGSPFAMSQDQVADLISLPFNLASVRRGRHWKLLDEERDMLAEPLTRQINENALLSRGLSIAADPLVIVLGFGFVIWARVEEDRHRARNARPVGPDRPGGAGPDAPPSAGGDRSGPVRRGPGGSGSLNGYPIGADDQPGREADAPQDQERTLDQAF